MKSVKPGRGPSMMGGVMSIFMALFGVFWTVTAVSIGAGPFFALFGVFFIGAAIVQAVYNFKNATGKNRYSSFDIVDSREEEDPWNRRFGEAPPPPQNGEAPQTDINYCPYCGAALQEDFAFCPKCGRELPK